MFEPLNPTLFYQLRRVFGTVKVSNEGQCLVGSYAIDPLDERYRLNLTNAGEEYGVNCFVCGDTRHRLSINHMWGVRDDEGNRNLWMAHCYNEPCLSGLRGAENRATLLEMVEQGRSLAGAQINPGVVVTIAKIVQPPGPVFNLADLPPYHQACEYLASRGFDPVYLGKTYGVGYCVEATFWPARNRIFIPLYDGGDLRGYQMRYVGEPPDKRTPKYWSCPNMDRKLLLYNLDVAVNYETVVLVEGPMDAWSVGPMAFASWGFPPTALQIREIIATLAGRTLIILPDPDVYEQPSKIRTLKAQYHQLLDSKKFNGVAVINLKVGDPGSMEQETVRAIVEAKAAVKGVKVSWERQVAPVA